MFNLFGKGEDKTQLGEFFGGGERQGEAPNGYDRLFSQGQFQISPESTEKQLDRKRALLRHLISKMGSAKYTGQGLAQMAQGVMAGQMSPRLDDLERTRIAEAEAKIEAEKAAAAARVQGKRQASESEFQTMAAGLFGGGEQPTPLPAAPPVSPPVSPSMNSGRSPFRFPGV